MSSSLACPSELKFELARRNAVSLAHGMVDEIRVAYDFDDLASFLACYHEGMTVLRTERDFTNLAMAYLRRAASQNVRYAEIFFDPQAHTSRGVPFEVIVQCLHRALPGRGNPVCHSHPAHQVLPARSPRRGRNDDADGVAAIPWWIVGVGLDSDERGNPPVKFAAVFAHARQEG